MTAQLDLSFEPMRAPEVTASEIDFLINRLRGQGWKTARDLGARTDSERREIRAIAEAATPLIISGQKGYKLTEDATPDEIASFRWMISQARKNVRRVVRTIRYWHSLPHVS